MVIIDSSESSSDEEDRRLRPIRRHDIGVGAGPRIFDASERPEGAARAEFFLGVNEEQCKDNFQISYQNHTNRNRATAGSNLDHCLTEQLTQDVVQEMIAHTKSLESIAQRIEKIPSQSLATTKLRLGLKLVNEYLDGVIDVSNNNIHSNEIYDYTASIRDAKQSAEELYNPFEGRDYYSLDIADDILIKRNRGKNDTPKKKDAYSQTDISGEVIPREATAALEFFQELIKNS